MGKPHTQPHSSGRTRGYRAGDVRTLSWCLAMVAVTAAVVLMLAGCGSSDDPQPAPPTPTTSSPTPTAPPTPTPPAMPEAAKQHTKEGAEAFVRYFWEVVNYAQATGDTARIRELSDPDCAFCAAGMEGIEAIYSVGGSLQGGLAQPTVFKTQLLLSNNTRFAVVDVDLQIGALVTTHGDTGATSESKSRMARDRFELVQLSSGWVVSKITSDL